MADKDETRYMEVVDLAKLSGKRPFKEYVLKLAENYNLNIFTASIPEYRVNEYEQSCMCLMTGSPELYEYTYWRMKLNEQRHDWYRCNLPVPSSNFFPELRNAIQK
jgi:hypothetical protein